MAEISVTIDTLQHVTTLATGFVSSLIAAGGLGWWISKQLRKVEKIAEQSLDKHEARDQQRHDDNLKQFREMNNRFTDVAVALARMGNGGFNDRRQ